MVCGFQNFTAMNAIATIVFGSEPHGSVGAVACAAGSALRSH
jgi:hypothetical protein